MSIRALALAAVALQVLTSAARAEQMAAAAERTPLVAVTHHEGRFNGQKVPYTAIVAETFLKDADGKPAASVVTTSYVRSDVTDPASRPVLFLFNGGPGASTTPLHFGAFGPKRRTGEGAAQRMVDNPDSPLDAVDLVFIDPVGTGYSRPFPGVDGKRYWSRTSDALSVKHVIREWLRTHGRESSPRYLLGQSYGTVRAAMILGHGENLEFDGVLLFALAASVPGNEMPYVTLLPSYAAAAWYHNRVPRDGRAVEQVYAEAVEFARTEYVSALIRGASLPAQERRAVAEKMAGLIGLSADLIEQRDLRIDRRTFMFNLLKDQGLRTGQLDARATAPLDAPPRRPPYDDPGLNYNPEAAGEAGSAAGQATGRKATRRGKTGGKPAGDAPSALERYYREVLKFRSPETYNALNLDVNSAWDHEGGSDVMAHFTKAMREHPRLRLMWVAGLYDLTTPAYAGRYAFDQAGVPSDRLVEALFPGGHSVYTESANRKALADAVRRFVTTSGAAASAGSSERVAPAVEAGFDVLLKPRRDGGQEVTAIEVWSELDAPAGTPLSLTAPVVYAALRGVADRVENLHVYDAAGAVPLTVSEDPPVPGGFPYYRHWKAQRPVNYPVTVTYRSLVQPPGSPNGPPFGIRPSGGGVSGAGSGFLVLPEGIEEAVLRVKWDLSDLPPGSIGVTSFGEGSFELRGPPSQLMQGWYMAGPVGRFPEEGDVDGFSATWLGSPPFDAHAEMAWAAKLYGYLGQAFGYLNPPPRYRVFIRVLDTPPFGGGTALTRSFMLSRGPGEPQEQGPRLTFAHEMIHQWVGGIDAPYGVSSWFSEGLTTYYTAVLPMRGGFISIDEYGSAIEAIARGYWGSPGRDWPATRIAEVGFGDERIRHVPYNRGALYFADLDARIRAKSNGKRRLDDLLGQVFRSREAGVRIDHAAWKALVTKELGPSAADEFESVILEGRMLTPAPDAFGPCFERRPKTYDVDGEKVEGFTWVRVQGIAESVCRQW